MKSIGKGYAGLSFVNKPFKIIGRILSFSLFTSNDDFIFTTSDNQIITFKG